MRERAPAQSASEAQRAEKNAYFAERLARLRELAIRGVESKNWRVDMGLSTLKTTVLVNSHTQTVIVAFRGSYSVGDWASNIRRIVPGDEDKSQSFQDAERVALDQRRRRRTW